MPPFSSADPAAFVGLGIQSALGTPQTAQAKFRFAKYLAGTSFQPNQDVQDIREGGDGLDFGFSYKRQVKGAGQLVFNARPEFLGQALALIPGGATWDGSSGPALHTFHTGHASHPWGTLQIGHPATSIVHFLQDVRFTALRMEWAAGGIVRVTMPYTALVFGASSTILTPTVAIEDPFLFHSTPSYQYGGEVATGITRFAVNLDLGVEELQSQAVTLDEAVVQNRDTNWEMEKRYADSGRWREVYYGATGNVAPTTAVATAAFRSINLYGAGADQKKLEVFLGLLSLRSDVLTELDPDGRTIMETFSGRALKGATHTAVFKLSNAHASAYGA